MNDARAGSAALSGAEAAKPSAWARTLAFLIDSALAWLPALGVLLLFQPPALVVTAVDAGLYLVYRCVLPTIRDYDSPGRAIFRWRVRVAQRSTTPSIGRLFVRELPVAAMGLWPIAGDFLLFQTLGLILVADFFFALNRPDRRSLRDLLAGTEILPLSDLPAHQPQEDQPTKRAPSATTVEASAVESLRPTAWRRAAAFLVDAAVVWVAARLVGLALGGSLFVNAALYLLYRPVLPLLWSDGTLGRALFGTRVQVVQEHNRPGLGRLLVRELPIALVIAAIAGADLFFSGATAVLLILFLAFSVGPLLLGLDFLFVVTRPDRRSLRDLIAGTEVLRIR